jgi:hypothetical protein
MEITARFYGIVRVPAIISDFHSDQFNKTIPCDRLMKRYQSMSFYQVDKLTPVTFPVFRF